LINIDYTNRTPIYEQIVNEIERYVTLGLLKPKQKIESVREMASSLGINPNTVKKAYDELERRGAIVTLSTKGTFIADDIASVSKAKIDEKLAVIKNEVLELEKLGLSKEQIQKHIF
jgi:GntR family transcriptional regulator